MTTTARNAPVVTGNSRSVTWRVLLVVGAVLAIGFVGLGLRAYQSNEIVTCEISAADGGGNQRFFGNIGDVVGPGCRYAQRNAEGVQEARWWWFSAGSVIVLTFSLMPLTLLREGGRVAASPEDVSPETVEPKP